MASSQVPQDKNPSHAAWARSLSKEKSRSGNTFCLVHAASFAKRNRTWLARITLQIGRVWIIHRLLTRSVVGNGPVKYPFTCRPHVYVREKECTTKTVQPFLRLHLSPHAASHSLVPEKEKPRSCISSKYAEQPLRLGTEARAKGPLSCRPTTSAQGDQRRYP